MINELFVNVLFVSPTNVDLSSSMDLAPKIRKQRGQKTMGRAQHNMITLVFPQKQRPQNQPNIHLLCWLSCFFLGNP